MFLFYCGHPKAVWKGQDVCNEITAFWKKAALILADSTKRCLEEYIRRLLLNIRRLLLNTSYL